MGLDDRAADGRPMPRPSFLLVMKESNIASPNAGSAPGLLSRASSVTKDIAFQCLKCGSRSAARISTIGCNVSFLERRSAACAILRFRREIL
jgi:hypothetical protein